MVLGELDVGLGTWELKVLSVEWEFGSGDWGIVSGEWWWGFGTGDRRVATSWSYELN